MRTRRRPTRVTTIPLPAANFPIHQRPINAPIAAARTPARQIQECNKRFGGYCIADSISPCWLMKTNSAAQCSSDGERHGRVTPHRAIQISVERIHACSISKHQLQARPGPRVHHHTRPPAAVRLFPPDLPREQVRVHEIHHDGERRAHIGPPRRQTLNGPATTVSTNAINGLEARMQCLYQTRRWCPTVRASAGIDVRPDPSGRGNRDPVLAELDDPKFTAPGYLRPAAVETA